MKPVKRITDPSSMELLGDETRRRLIYLLRARELSISQLADELGVTPQAIYHHVKKLIAAGMIEVSREARIENFIEKYYRATAEVFEFSWGSTGGSKQQARMAEQRMRDTLLSLGKVGLKVKINDETVSRIMSVSRKIQDLSEREDLRDKVSKLDDVDFLGKQQLTSVATTLSMSDSQFQQWLELNKEFRQLLKSLQGKQSGKQS